MNKLIILSLLLSLVVHKVFSQEVPFPESTPPVDEIGLWGHTDKGTSWDTSPYIPFYYNRNPESDIVFRFMPPNDVTYDENNNSWINNDPEKTYPIILFFHGKGESGSDNNNQLKHGGEVHRDAVLSGEFPGFLCYPQGAVESEMKDLLYKLVNDGVPIDLTRVYVHGLSLGATRTWEFALAYPDIPAAIWPMSGIIGSDSYTDINYTPIRLTQGSRDTAPRPEGSQAVVDQIETEGGQIEYIVIDAGHGTWNQMYGRDDFFTWFLSQKSTKIYAKFGYYEVCPTDPVEVTLGVNQGYDYYEWRKDGEIIPGENLHELYITGGDEAFGNYSARAIIQGEYTEWSEDIVVAERQPTQTPPISLATLQSTVLPDPNGSTTVDLTLPDGYETYQWYKDDSFYSSDQSISAPAGVYTALVTEKFGCSSFQSEAFTIINNSGSNVPETPTDVQVSTLSKTELEVTWSDNSSDEINIELYRRTAGGQFELIALLSPNTGIYNDTDLNPGTEYLYSIRNINENGASDLSIEIGGTTDSDQINPSVPLNFTLESISETSASFNWSASTDDVGISRYVIYQDGIPVISTTETFTSVFGLTQSVTYRFYVVAEDLSGNVSPESEILVVTPTIAGLNYEYYEGTWDNLPDFNAITPVKTGSSDNVDLSVREQNDYFAFKWTGKITIPVAGSYTFETYSDDGSKLYIGGYDESNKVVDNDGLHGVEFEEGTYTFPSAGSYDIVITFFEKDGDEQMEVYWKNTAHGVTDRERIPDNVFYEEVTLPEETLLTPSNLSHEVLSSTSIKLDWVDTNDNEINYQIFRSNSELDFEPVALLDANSTTFTDTNLEPNTTYWYKIVALGLYSTSDPALEISSSLNMSFDNSISDFSGNQVENTISGSIEFDSNNKIQGSHSIHFTGSGAYVNLDQGDRFIHDEFSERSISFWIYTDDLSGLQDVYDEGGATNGIALRINNGSIELGVRDDYVEATIMATIPQSSWTHVTAIFNNGTIQLFINGTLATSQNNLSYTSVSSHGNAGGLGATNSDNAFGDKNNNFNGWIDDLFIFNFAINESTINDLIDLASYEYIIATTDLAPGLNDPLENFAVELFDSLAIKLSWDIKDGVNYYYLSRSAHTDQDFGYLSLVRGNNNDYVDQMVEAHTTYFYNARSISSQGYSERSDTLSVTTPNSLPTFGTEIPDYDLFYSDNINLLVEASDKDGDIVTFSSSGFPSFISLTDNGDNTANLSIQANPEDFGTYSNLSVSIDDGYGGIKSEIFDVSVISNYAPVIDSIDYYYEIGGGSNLNLIFDVTDTDNDNITWEITGLPSFATNSSLTNNSLTLDFNPSLSNDGGIYTIILKASDDNPYNPKFDEFAFDVTVIPFDPNHLIYINLGNSALTPAPEPWNNFTFSSTSAGRSLSGLKTTLGFELAASISLETAWNGFEKGIIPGTVPDEVLDAGMKTTGDIETIKVAGLDPTSTYNFQILASSKFEGDRSTTFEINGTTSTIQASLNSSQFAEINDISPESNGDININVIRPETSISANLNAILIEAVSSNGIVPIKPTDLNYEFSGNSISLNWSDNSYNETGFEVFRSSPDNLNYISVGTVTSTTLLDESFPNADLYYKVRAINSYGESDFSNELFIEYQNRPPIVEGHNDIEMTPLEQEVLNITISDPEEDDVIIDIVDLPSFMSSNIVDNDVTLTASPTMDDIGSYELTINAEDINSNNVSAIIEVHIVEALYDTILVNVGANINMNAPFPWNNFVGTPSAGSSLANLSTTSGVGSNITVELLESWGSSETKGEITGDDSGVYPDDVMENYIANDDGSLRSIKLSGLQADYTYDLTLFGSRSIITDSRIMEFSYNIYSSFLDVTQNTSDVANLNGLKADINGEIVVTIKGENTQWVYLNALTIEYHPDTQFPIAPSSLVASTDSTDRIRLSWFDNSSNEDGFEIYNSSSSDGPWSLLDILPANSTSYNHTGLPSNDMNYYYVQAYSSSSSSLRSNIAGRSTYANVVYLNVGGPEVEESIDGIAGFPWNNTANELPEVGDITSILTNDQGDDTGIRMELIDSSPFNWGGAGYLGVVTNDDSGVFPDDVLKTYFWFESGSFVKVKFSGLQLNQIFDFEFMASRTSSNRGTRFIIGTDSVDLEATGNTSETVRINGVMPNTFGEIIVHMTSPEGYGNAYFNAVVIRSTTHSNYSSRIASTVEDGQNTDFQTLEKSNELIVYPNPASEFINVNFESGGSDEIRLVIYDLSGKTLIMSDNMISNGQEISLDISLLNKGSYILEVKNSLGKRSFKRIIKE